MNFGMKKHNGGAISLVCEFISKANSIEYASNSGF